jgi:DNA-binding IclR family transcriptional regulator
MERTGLPVTHTNSAARAVAVVEFLAFNASRTFTLSEIARYCGLRKSTAHTVLQTLHEAGWLVRSPSDLKYGLGPTMVGIGQAAETTRPAVALARPVLQRLVAELQRECVLSTVVDTDIVVLESLGARMNRRLAQPGQRESWVVPLGVVFVAWSDHGTREGWYERSGVTSVHERDRLDERLERIRSRGYVATTSTDLSQERARLLKAVEAGRTLTDVRRILDEQISELPTWRHVLDDPVAEIEIASIQVPVFDEDGVATFAITVPDLGFRVDAAGLDRVGSRLRAAADDLSAAVADQVRRG